MIKSVALVAFIIGGCMVSEALATCYNFTAVSPCTHFTVCNASVSELVACPDGLLFNNDTYQCDWPYNVNTTTCTNITYHTANEGCTDGAFRYNPESSPNCTGFQICFNGEWGYNGTCAEGTLFNNASGICTHNYTVNPLDCSSLATECYAGQTRAADGTDCADFNVCLDLFWADYNISCPVGTLFNEDVNTCDFDYLVDTSTCTTVVPSGADACAAGSVRVAEDTSCAEYQLCGARNTWISFNYTCPTGTLFNNESLVCDTSSRINTTDCSAYQYPGVDCTGVATDEPIVAANNCTHYYYCADDYTPILYICESSLQFNLNASYCMDAANVTADCYSDTGIHTGIHTAIL